jgi:hypothetical protein
MEYSKRFCTEYGHSHPPLSCRITYIICILSYTWNIVSLLMTSEAINEGALIGNDTALTRAANVTYARVLAVEPYLVMLAEQLLSSLDIDMTAYQLQCAPVGCQILELVPVT